MRVTRAASCATWLSTKKEDKEEAFLVSITHLAFDHRLPVARKIAAYQKHPSSASDATVRPTLPLPITSGRSSMQPERPKHPVRYTKE
jgi:hypothetical protein